MASPNKLILMVEDSDNDVSFFKERLRKPPLEIPCTLYTVDQAIAYLEGAVPFTDRAQFPLPSILILDLQLPNKDGFQLLEWLGQRPEFRRLHVVVLAGFGRMQEINRAYQNGRQLLLDQAA